MIRTRVADLRVMGRNTQGVKLMDLEEGDTIVDVTRAVAEEEEASEGAETGAETDE
jgi:DNA gyrase subunit A